MALSLIITLSLALLLSACKGSDTPQNNEQPKYQFRPDGMLQVLAPSGDLKAEFEIEIAKTAAQLEQGLKYRETMLENQAMLFLLSGTRPHEFWMQDTYLSLDIIYIDASNTIFQIYKNTQPFSEELLSPAGINLYTLEVIAGTTDKLNIKEGDTIKWQEN